MGRRRNNLTEIRIVLAWSVIYGHAFALSAVHRAEPVSTFLNGFIGTMAVDTFFFLSGYLVSVSFKQHGLFGYGIARVARIFPAAIVVTLVSVLLIGPLAVNQPVGVYFTDPETWSFLKNATFTMHVQWDLPGVFTGQHFTAINGSWWTLPVELRFYAIVAVIGALGLLRRIGAVIVVPAFLYLFYRAVFGAPIAGWQVYHLPAVYFLAGVSTYLLTPTMRLWMWPTFLVLPAALAAHLFPSIALGFNPFLIYALLVIAFRAPDLPFRTPDVSYGLYLYGWPAAQIAIWIKPGIGPWWLALAATFIALAAALLSWFLLEKPALRFSRRIMALRLPERLWGLLASLRDRDRRVEARLDLG